MKTLKVGSGNGFGYKPRQDRKVATVSDLKSCARKPDWSFYPLSPFRLQANLPHDRVLEAHLGTASGRLLNCFDY